MLSAIFCIFESCVSNNDQKYGNDMEISFP